MNYTLKHKNRNIAIFSIQTKSVDQCIINKHTMSELPLPLKRLVKEGYKEEFVFNFLKKRSKILFFLLK